MMGIRNVFTLCTKHRGLLLQAVCWVWRVCCLLPVLLSFTQSPFLHPSPLFLQLRDREVAEWLYAFDPLLAGTILSREGLRKQ